MTFILLLRSSSHYALLQAERAEHALLGSLHAVCVNVERCPIIDAEVPLGCQREDAHLRKPLEKCLAKKGLLVHVIDRSNQDIRMGLLHTRLDLFFVLDFTDDFDVRLVGYRRYQKFAHQARPVRNKHSCFVHVAPRNLREYLKLTNVWEGSKMG
jgi:hypothetical protein